MRKILAFIVSAVFLFTMTACGDEPSDGRNYSFSYALSENPQNLDPQLAADSNSLTIIENMFEGLTATDENGAVAYGAAQSCEISEDNLTYTFTLRDDCFWNDGVNEPYAVTADDFVFAFQRIFNPVMQSPYRETFSCIKNASKIINNQLEYTELGVYAPDDLTVVFELDYRNPCFMELLSTSPAMPCSQKFFESTNARYGLDDKSVISNGSFYIKQWFYDPYGSDNFILMKRNSANSSEKHDIVPNSINFTIEKADADINESFRTGNYDCIISGSKSDYDNILSRSFTVNEFAYKTLGIIMNCESEQLSDENIRKALTYSLDRNSYKDKLISSYQAAYGIVPPCMMTGDSYYRKIIDDSMLSVYDKQKALEHINKSENIPNLTLMTTAEYADTVYMNELAASWLDNLGIYVRVEEVELSEYKRRIAEKDYQLAVYEITANYNNPYDILNIFRSGNNNFGYSSSDTDNLLEKSTVLNGTEKRCQAYYEAERNIIENCGFIPVYYKKIYCIYGSGSQDIIFDPFKNTVNFRYGKNFS
mgnify:FL=1